METFLKILAFLVVELIVLGGLYMFPRSSVSRMAFSWHGPFPENNETYAHYRVRRALWVGTLLCQLVIILFAGAWVIRSHPSMSGGFFEHIFMAFTGVGWVAIGCILWHLCTALKAALFGPNPVYEVRRSG